MLKPSSFSTNDTKIMRTIHFKFGGQFEVRRKGWEESLYNTSVDFFISNITALANRKKDFHQNRPPKN